MTSSCKIMIIGAGPVGLTLAAYLDYYGVKPRIIDSKASPTQTSNAVAVQPRTLELLDIIGLGEEFRHHGRHITSGKFYSNGQALGSIDCAYVHSPYPYICTLPQSHSEALLLAYLAKRGVIVEREQTLTNIQQQDDKVIVTLQQESNTQQIECAWVVGCDGYRSTVRELLKIPYEGDDLDFHFLMIDAPIQWDYSLDTFYIGFANQLSVAMFPMQQSVRILAEVSQHPQYNQISDADEIVFSEIVKKTLPGNMHIDKPLWASKFWVHERLAQHYRIGQIFLAGDAAHAHSPAGGQGMNTGMQDAINLAWKLAWTIQGYTTDKILASYEQERRPIAAHVLKFSGVQTKIALNSNPIMQMVRNHLAPLAMKIPYIQEKIINEITETKITYQHSDIVAGKTLNHLSPGDYILYTDHYLPHDHYLLIDANGNAEELLSAVPYKQHIIILSTQQLQQHPQFSTFNKGYCLLRPDYYIGYIGNDANALLQYLSLIF